MRSRNLTVAGLVAAFAPAAFGVVIYQDGTFTPANWAIETAVIGGGGNGTGVQVLSGGLPGAARRVTTNVNAPAGSGVVLFNRYGNSGATRYEPAVQGEIGSVSLELDARMITGFGDGHGISVALKQGQIIYSGPGRATGSSGSWVHLSFNGVTSTEFVRVDGQPGHPDFSTSGARIRFGFTTSNSTTGGAYSIVVDYDNFDLRVLPPCAADFNRDGGVDGSDVSAFFSAWEAGEGGADVNADGGVDGSDVDAFFALWEAGGC
jgi:hypothetical protein